MLPLLIYDGDCSFCKLWIEYWKKLTGERIEYAPYQEVADRFPGIPREQFQAAVQLVTPEGRIYSGAGAVFRALSYAPGKRVGLWLYEHVPGFAPASEWFYHWVAGHRDPLYTLTVLLWGKRLEPAEYVQTRALMLRLLGAIYVIAFSSWYVQIPGLIGEQGILSAVQYLLSVRQQMGARAYFVLPTLVWLHPSDAFMRIMAGAGIVLGFLAVLGVALGPCLVLLWMLYLSQVVVGSDFMAFQWDVLLLEAGFLAIFFAPWRLPGRKASAPSPALVWLFRWLLFRVVFFSGVVKLLSHDAAWRNLTALTYHFYTQPLPDAVSWYWQQAPVWFLKLCCVIMFGIELGAPFFVFAPRRLRLGAAFVLVLFQALIGATGNYTFFSLLVMVLCISLLDDRAVAGAIPAWLRARFAAGGQITTRSVPRRALAGGLAFLVLWVSVLQMARTFAGRRPEIGDPISRGVSPFYLVNTYGLFAVMTTKRVEIVMEGSDDRQSWKAYEFKYKPGDVKRPPPFVEPYQPRLDWQMWFAALSNFRDQPWFINFAVRLLQGSPDVLRLLAKNPFPDHPPHYIRAVVYDYRFTTFAERRATGDWWHREPLGSYLPPIALRAIQ